MRVMLDTHALLWALSDSPRLSKTARRVIENGRNEVIVSAVCAWEIAIKTSMGKLRAPDDLIAAVDDAGFTRVAVGFAEARRLASLPHHHGDPFDRMLIAHALEEGTPIVTKDDWIAAYQVQTIW
jgi:PIN domain nuclease of toxin-antitoxin system